MISKMKKGMALVVTGLSLILFVVGCIGVSPQASQEIQVVYPTVVITQYVTQVVATPTATPPPPPTPVSNENTVAYAGWDPSTMPIYYPIQGCVASRLHVDDVAFLASGAGTVGIHQSQDIGYAPIFRELAPGEAVDIVKGPWCNRGAVVWKIATADGVIGFVPEGDGSTYWLFPMPVGTDRVLPKAEYKLLEQIGPGAMAGGLQFGNNGCK